MVDAWLGVPLCWVLTVVRRLADLFRQPTDRRRRGRSSSSSSSSWAPTFRHTRPSAARWRWWAARTSISGSSRTACRSCGSWTRCRQENIIVVRSKGILRIVLDLLEHGVAHSANEDRHRDRHGVLFAGVGVPGLSERREAPRGAAPLHFDRTLPRRPDDPPRAVQSLHPRQRLFLFAGRGPAIAARRVSAAQAADLPPNRWRRSASCRRRKSCSGVQQKLDERAGFSVRRPIVLLNPNVSDIVPSAIVAHGAVYGDCAAVVGAASGIDGRAHRARRGGARAAGPRNRARRGC